ncbi:MAG TPA: alpha/beta hydrolase [Terracidiphilus sp.]|nr:alpha/beta hydrolase [Terracidiphilus sp.]
MQRRLLPSLLISVVSFFALGSVAQTGAPVTGVIHSPDVDLGYEVYGQPTGETPVIAVNGGPGLSHKYMIQNNVWEKLAERRQVVFYDQRGTGASKHLQPGASQTMDAQVGDLEAVRTHFGFEKVDLVGDSYGGFLAMAYASTHPERVHKLILSDSPPPAFKDMVHLLPQVFPDIEEEDAAIQKQSGDTDEAAQKQLLNHFRMIFYSEDLLHAYLAHIGDLGYVPSVGAAVSQSAAKIDMTAQLPKFNLPVLVITGRHDMNVAPLNAWRMYKAIPGAKLEVFAKSGHLPSYEEPDKYVKVVEDFLSAK